MISFILSYFGYVKVPKPMVQLAETMLHLAETNPTDPFLIKGLKTWRDWARSAKRLTF